MGTATDVWNEEREKLSRQTLRAIQGERLREQVTHVYRNADFYSELYDEADLHPNDVGGIEDIHKVPTMEKDDLREYRQRTGDFWCGTRCVPESDLLFGTQSTGTSGKPNFFGLTASDYEAMGEVWARHLYSWGFRRGDTVNQVGGALWNGAAIGWEAGLNQIGATPIRSTAHAQTLPETMFELQREADFDALLVYQPEFEREYLAANDIDPLEVFPNLRFVCSQTDASEPKRALFEEIWGVPFKNGYGSGDQFFVASECGEDGQFCHVPEDLFILEVLDPETGEPVDEGEYGEVFLTNLWCEANPYIRYRLGDIVEYKTGRCSCGRTTMRVRPLGRLSWSVSVEGRDRLVTSTEVEEVIWRDDDLRGKNYQLVETSPGTQEVLRVRVAAQESVPEGTIDDVAAALESEFGVPATFEVVDPDDIGLESAIKLERVKRDY